MRDIEKMIKVKIIVTDDGKCCSFWCQYLIIQLTAGKDVYSKCTLYDRILTTPSQKSEGEPPRCLECRKEFMFPQGGG